MFYKLCNKKIFLILLLLINFSPNSLPQEKTKLLYMGNYNKYPYEFIDKDGKPEGFNIDVIKEIGKVMGFELEFQLKPWKQVKDSVLYGDSFDISAMFYSEQREQTVDFSNPVIFSEDEIFIPKDSKNINSMIDLMNKKVAVEDGSYTGEYLEHNLSDINIIPVESEPDALKMVSENKCDAAVVERINGESNKARLGLTNIKATAYPMIPREYGFVVAKGNDSLLSKINVGLEVIKKNGTYAFLFNKWINPPPPKTVALKTIVSWGIAIILILFLITGLTYFWIKSLRMLVFKKTIELRKEIEEHIKTEKELKIQKERAEESNRLKSEFLAQMSHEIRTPLNVILSYTSLIEIEIKDYLNDDIADIINSINEASHRLLRTVTSILDMSAIKINKYEADFEIININELIENLYKNFNSQAKKKKLEIELQQDIKNILIKGDYYTTLKLFENIIDNAVKYTDKGTINIKIERTQNGKITVKVRDTGIGISKEYFPKIFEPFTQESTGDTRKFDGNGLGLALVKEYAEMNNYEIKIASEKEVGTTVTVLMRAE